ncbi:hypothetical protein BO70DRAFT_195942 [Aspergillus heteromorphus CBS 117.55]|uniref:Uncharacterized protein n=1 Tax=Aspergillus heteromorphus CBS 117.55 TaxID=1448321 RepID=A0A317WLZ2_9EURO|nr:uncharacterized protein BO70DRAFT_195942 [Aspergillus heteromorphus CBS 117.55]PWY87516.1 hypothetical protein BO70DRAFT_195942 [Aspergillus heteromorphus CBS 117.55]
MGWFPTTLDSDAQSWRFDIVSLLAVIGGSTIEKHLQAITASPFAGFPRLLPAPETLLDTDRPTRLPSIKEVSITGVYSGTRTSELNFFANVIHKLEDVKDFEFRSYTITHAEEEKDPESTGKPDNLQSEIIIPLQTLCPLNLVTLVSILMTIGLFIWAGMIHDGVALVGLATMSLSTSSACLSAQWYPRLPRRPTNNEVAPGNIVMKTRNGAFVVVECSEEIARELYGGTETCKYVFQGRAHQSLLACSTVLLMASIILFSNCGWTMQIAVGVAYIILNILYWAMALLTEPQDTWDMSRYQVKQDDPIISGSYTAVLWQAIKKTRQIDWVRSGNLAPQTPAWDDWLLEAKRAYTKNDNSWNPERARDRLMGVPRTPIVTEPHPQLSENRT